LPKQIPIIPAIIIGAIAIIGFTIGYTSLPSLLQMFVLIALGISVAWLIYADKEFSDTATLVVSPLLLLGAGMFLGILLNISLSLEFLAKPSISFLILPLFMEGILLFLVFSRARNVSKREKLSYVLLGVSMFSIVSAFSTFVHIVIAYLPLYPNEGMPGMFTNFRFSLIIDIFKSLFLSALFGGLGHLIRLTENRK